MRRLVILTLLAFFPAAVSAAPVSRPRAAGTKATAPKKQKDSVDAKPDPVPTSTVMAPPAPAAAPSDTPTVDAPSLSPESATGAPEARLFGEPARRSTVHRYAFVVGGVAAVTGAAFGYWAQGETKRAQSIGNAAESRRVLDGAKRTAASASLLYGVAAASLVYGLAIELLPQKVADKASLTYHF